MQNKPQIAEAVLFFGEHGICKEMLYPEFEALLDGVVDMPEFADQQMRVAYVLINPRLLIRGVVFFYLDFNEDGSADSGWNIPLRHLAERAGRGPDLGAGPIRLACRSQCPVAWHQMHLWDPSLAPGKNDLVLLRDQIKRNQMGLLVDDETPASVPAERLQMAAEDRWVAADPAKDEAAKQAEKLEQEHRLKTAQLIKQQRLRIASLSQQREDEIAQLRQISESQQNQLREELRQLQQKLRQQEDLNASLKNQLATQVESFQKAREEMSEQVRSLERHGRAEVDVARAQFEREVEARVAAAVVEYKEQIAIRDVELSYRNELDTALEEEIERLKREREELVRQGSDNILEKLSRLGVVFVVYHPGAGHLTIALQDIARYQENPMAYAASKCFVSEEQYRQWLKHYQDPSCEASLSSGERCAIPLDRVDTPARFVVNESNCCSRHKSEHRLRTGS
ncbi:chromosome partitioning protein ParA [Stutzerimonas nosocomialis]|uniref:Chromosome partitioning protein ParA n=1 Tax=Stutzerimonas nosocomialis TaxID=1056496 RepID=A0A5R9QIZ3_9GAMM|nr:chromosome partitioning protein ParA [Stutzerimonas nosocomialis]TLX57135.1 chromosome partitioning protein ParA [Stutzerimonas nosocomialis]TLX58142.1 chromosome partitioning protein ParA [Stutzerimonas nosocomialis]TLX65241.1 chromosome partitioning protein ParA [Stutzerimonas nosocomialis]